MNATRYILRSVAHFRFAYVGVLAGAVLGATVLLGALFAGDSIKASLRQIAGQRIGRATHVVAGGDRFFRQALADDLTAAGMRSAPLLLARGTVTHGETRASGNQVQLVGVTPAFWQFAPTPAEPRLSAGQAAVAINDTLAHRLALKLGDTLVVRLQKPGILAGNAPVAGAEPTLQSLRCTVAAIVDSANYGRFGLEATQVPSASVFLPIELLQETLNRPGKANVLLAEVSETAVDLPVVLARTVRLADYGLALRWLETAGLFELTSDRIFIDPELATATSAALPAARPVVSYLVNEFRAGERTTPYSIATATTSEAAPFLPADLGPREIVLNQWLADDLEAGAGAEVRLTFFQTGAAGRLVEHAETFRVRTVIPLEGLAADRAWMPAFPGISDVSNQGDWDPGLPLDLARIRNKDEEYWDNHRGAPKAFLSAAAGRELWSTRWGSVTALRIPRPRAEEAALTAELLGAFRPEMNQLLLRDLRSSAQAAAQSPVDFGGLFVGMSFFLIVAALGLVAMLFQLSLLQRNREDALLGAVGVPASRLLRWRLGESGVLLLVAAAVALPLAIIYTRAILRFVGSIWSGESGVAVFTFAAQPVSIAVGIATFILLSLLAIWLAIRRQARRTLSIRLAAHSEETGSPVKVRRSSRIVAVVATTMGLIALGLSGRALPAQIAFYLAGFAWLAAGIAICRGRLARLPAASAKAPLDAGYVGRLNLVARRSRHLVVAGLIATAVFMVLSVASFRKHAGPAALARTGGTGGFTFWVETTAALNAARDGLAGAFEGFDRHTAALGDIVPLRLGAGDNANCFNLNTPSQPRLLAVDAARFATRGAFTLRSASGGGRDSPWTRLQRAEPDGAVPAFVDETTLLWALKKKVGDTIAYADENGATFTVRIIGAIPDSIFQGYVIVDEQPFLERYPSNPGYSVFLADAKDTQASADLASLRRRLETALADAGGRVDLARDVLAEFHRIENTYIAIFNVLGSLGVVLGSLGLTIVVARNLRERRGEFAVMTAIGLPRSVLARMVMAEFGRLLLWGVAIGALAAVVAVGPNLRTLPPAPTLALVGGLLAGIVALNVACGWMVFRWSLRELRPSVALAAG